MPRIYLETDELRLNRLEEIGRQLTKDQEVSASKMRSAALDYLIDTITQAHNALAAHKAEISRLEKQITDQASSSVIQGQLDTLTEEHDRLEGRYNYASNTLRRMEHGVNGMMSTIWFLVEKVREYEE